MDALKANVDDAYMNMAIAKVFWNENKPEKIKKWILRAVTCDKDIGDVWALYYRYECEFGTNESRQEVIKAAAEAYPHHG